MDDRETLIDEYRSLRSEIMKKQDARLVIVGFSITGIATLLGILLNFLNSSQSVNYSPIIAILILAVIIISLSLIILQTTQLDAMFINLKISETLAKYHGFFTDSLSKIESQTRLVLVAFYSILLISILIALNYQNLSQINIYYIIMFIMDLNPLQCIIIILFISNIYLLYKLSQKGIRTEEFQVDFLKVFLKDENKNYRKRAAEALGDIGNSRAIKPLINAFNDENEEVRHSAKEALIKIQNSSETLISALKNDHYLIRMNAAEALGEIKDTKAVMPLIAVLNDENWEVIWKSVISLGEIGDKQAIDPIINVLEDENINVQSAAAKALGKLGKGDTKVTEALINFVLNKKSWNSREEAVNALIELKDPLMFKKLIEDLKNQPVIYIDSELVYYKIFKDLKNMAIEHLIAALNDMGENEDENCNVAKMLRLIGDQRIINSLENYLKEDKPCKSRIRQVLKELKEK